jgi:hypothetical protein
VPLGRRRAGSGWAHSGRWGRHQASRASRSVEAIGDVVGVGVLGACAVGDGFSWGGEEFGAGELLVGVFGFGSCGVERCVADELLDVVQ